MLARDAGVDVPEELLAHAQRGEAGPGRSRARRSATSTASSVPASSSALRAVARGVMLGRELPFGVGVTLGGVANYRSMHRLGRTAIKHLQQKT